MYQLSVYQNLFLIENPGKTSEEKAFFKALLRGNLICNISETEDCRKLKFDEVSLYNLYVKTF